MIWILIPLSFAAIMSAVMDILENENFFSSRFANHDQKFWYKRESWKHARKFFGWKLDAWHIAKSLMVICVCGAMADSFFQFIVLGIVWNISFNLTYKWLKK